MKRSPIPRRSAPRKRKRGRAASLAREADRLWSLVVRKRGECEVCGSTLRLQAAHGFSRRYRNTRWLPINGFCLCSGDHKRFTHDPLGWDNFLRVAWGGDVYADLRVCALSQVKPDLGLSILDLRKELG